MAPQAAMAEILNSHVNDEEEHGMYHFRQEIGDFLFNMVEDLSIFESPSHEGDQARILEQVVPWGVFLLEKRGGTAVEPWGKEIKDAVGAVWRALRSVDKNEKVLNFPATRFWSDVKLKFEEENDPAAKSAAAGLKGLSRG